MYSVRNRLFEQTFLPIWATAVARGGWPSFPNAGCDCQRFSDFQFSTCNNEYKVVTCLEISTLGLEMPGASIRVWRQSRLLAPDFDCQQFCNVQCILKKLWVGWKWTLKSSMYFMWHFQCIHWNMGDRQSIIRSSIVRIFKMIHIFDTRYEWLKFNTPGLEHCSHGGRTLLKGHAGHYEVSSVSRLEAKFDVHTMPPIVCTCESKLLCDSTFFYWYRSFPKVCVAQ